MADTSVTHPFIRTKNVETLLQILKPRLPNSAHIFNMVLTYPKFTEEMTFYTLSLGTGKTNSWVLAKYEREDKGAQISISTPNDCDAIPSSVEKAFRATPIIEWDKEYEFMALDRVVSNMIIEVSIHVHSNPIEVYPCNYYYLPPDEAKDLKISPLPAGAILKSLNSEAGIQFLAGPGLVTEANLSYIRKTAERNDYTLGIFVNEEPVSRICLATTGHMGFLRTLDGHGGKGYSTICLQSLARNLGRDTQIYPCSMVDIRNPASNRVHVKSGLRVSHLVDFVIYKGDVF